LGWLRPNTHEKSSTRAFDEPLIRYDLFCGTPDSLHSHLEWLYAPVLAS
jgi:hypothetical protein